MLLLLDEETKRQLIDSVMRLHEDPKQIVAYETKIQCPYTREQWPEHRAFLERAYKMSMFNRIFYHGPFGGRNTSVDDLVHFMNILKKLKMVFEKNPTGTVEYVIGTSVTTLSLFS